MATGNSDQNQAAINAVFGVSPTTEKINAALKGAAEALVNSVPEGLKFDASQLPPGFDTNITAMTNEIKADLEKSFGSFFGGGIAAAINGLILVFTEGAQFLAYILGTAIAMDEAGKNVGREVVRPTILTLGELLERLRRDPALLDNITPYIQKLGFDDTQIQWIMDLMHPLLSEGDIMAAWLRGLLTDGQMQAKLGEHGRTQDQITVMQGLTEEYPNLRDLILLDWWGLIDQPTFEKWARVSGWNSGVADMMKVAAQRLPAPVEALINARHGAFEADKIAKWNLHYALDPGFVQMMARQGVTEETALNYWAGHWSPLGVPSAIRLFQRGEMDEATLNEIYHLQGLAQGAWSYETLANYHVPEYFVLSAIVESTPLPLETITKMVTDMGYMPKYVPIIASAYHAKTNASTNKALQTQIEKALKNGTLSKSQAQTALANVGLSADQITSVMQNVEVEVQVENMDTALKYVRKDYIEKIISEEQAVSRMLGLGFSSTQVDYWMAQWAADRALYIKRLTEAQVGKLLKDGFMKTAQAMTYWESLGYSSEDAVYLRMYYTGA